MAKTVSTEVDVAVKGSFINKDSDQGDLEKAFTAIETVKKLLSLITIGPLIVVKGPHGIVHVDVPLIYDGVALDRIHYDPVNKGFSPKGRPVHVVLESFDEAEAKETIEKLVNELRVLDAVEYRELERCWVVPVAWRYYIVAHIKVDVNGEEIVPDRGLMSEIGGFIDPV